MCEYVTWQGGIKVADGSKVAKQLLVKWEDYFGYHKSPVNAEEGAKELESEWYNVRKTQPAIAGFE